MFSKILSAPILIVCFVTLQFVRLSSSFVVRPLTGGVVAGARINDASKGPQRRSGHTPLFGWFDKAFANEDMGAKKSAGLTNGPSAASEVSVNGKPCKAVVGQRISVVARAARADVEYNCNRGECGTCMVRVNGRNVLACQAVVPKGKCKIQTF